jgi:hypothetical protein
MDNQEWSIQKHRRRTVVLPLVLFELVEIICFNALEDSVEIVINTTAFPYYVTEYWIEGNNCQQWNQRFDNDGLRTNYRNNIAN